MQVEGVVTGIGNETTRKNEINPDDVAVFLNALFCGNSQKEEEAVGIIGANSFAVTANTDSSITISEGMCIVYGYLARIGETKILFNISALPQYWVIVAEIDRSVVPNTFSVRALNNQSLPTIGAYTLRKDRLSAIRTGAYQLPLAIVKVDGQTITVISDERVFFNETQHVKTADTTMRIIGVIEDGAKMSEDTVGGSDKHPCSCKNACYMIKQAIKS